MRQGEGTNLIVSAGFLLDQKTGEKSQGLGDLRLTLATAPLKCSKLDRS
jgi:hypothetical protein